MSFKPAKCPNCAGDLQVPEDRDTVKCMYCGSDIVVREAIKLAGGVNIENLLILAKNAEKINSWKEAYDYYTRILEYDPQNSEAWFCRGLSKLCQWEIKRAKDDNLIFKELELSITNALEYSNNQDNFQKEIINRLEERLKKEGRFEDIYISEDNIEQRWRVSGITNAILALDENHLESLVYKGILFKNVNSILKALSLTTYDAKYRNHLLDISIARFYRSDLFLKYIEDHYKENLLESKKYIVSRITEEIDHNYKYNDGFSSKYDRDTEFRKSFDNSDPDIIRRKRLIQEIKAVDNSYEPPKFKYLPTGFKWFRF